MASIFKNKFFSVAGQKERLANAGKTIVAAVLPKSLGGGVSSTLNPTSKVGKVANKVLETAASHPFATAAVGAVAAKPKVAIAAVKEVAKGTANLVKKVTGSTTGKVATAAATPAVVSKLAAPSNPTNIIMPGQPAGSNTPQPGQPYNGGAYVPPQPGVPGSVPGTQSNGVGMGGATDLVQRVVRTNEYQTEPGMSMADSQDYVGQETAGISDIGSSIGSPTNALQRANKRQKLVTPSYQARTKKARKTARKSPSKRKAKSSRKKSSRKSPSHSKGHFGSEAQFKKRGGFKVHYTKTGQPYIILKSGKARFIKKSKR